jgi:hypothetical protein
VYGFIELPAMAREIDTDSTPRGSHREAQETPVIVIGVAVTGVDSHVDQVFAGAQP